MTVSVNNTLNGAGGGASAADVAAAVAAALPTPATIQAGQVVEFAAGAVPAGYAQVSGADPVNAGTWEFAWPSYKHGLTSAVQIFAAGGKLVAIYGTGASSLQVLNDDYTVNGAAVALPSSYYGEYRLTPLANGKLLRIGSASNSSVGSSGVVQTFDPATRSIATLATKPTPVNSGYIAVEAGTGEVFGFNGAQIDRFANNVWAENVATAPANVLNAGLLPSGKILLVCATAQYILNPAAPASLVAVAAPVPFSSPRVAPLTTGARVFEMSATVGGLNNTMLAYDYNETTGAFVQLQPFARTPTAFSASYRMHTTTLKDGGVMLNWVGATGLDAIIHRVSYTPKGVVKAVKL